MLLLVLALVVPAVASVQTASVRGQLMCGGRPLSNTLVKMYDDDSGPDLDDLMAEGKTDSNGYFELSGSESEIMTIDVKINIYHDCDDGIIVSVHTNRQTESQKHLAKPCQRKVTIEVPDSYVTTGTVASKVYDMGTLNMEGKFPDEERDCIHRT